MQNVGLSVRGFDSSVDSVWLVAIYLPIIKCLELREDWHYSYKCLWTYPFLSLADRLSRGFLWFGTHPGSVWMERLHELHSQFSQGSCSGCCFIIQQSLFKKHPNYLRMLWLEESHYLNVDIQAGLLESQTLPALTWSPVNCQLAGPGPAMGRIQVGQHSLIFSQTQHNHILVVSATALFRREIKEMKTYFWKISMDTQDFVFT